jgi:hypothetical protein
MTNNEFHLLFLFAKNKAGTFKALAEQVGAPSIASVQMWAYNGVPHKYRIKMLELFEEEFKKTQEEQAQA